MSIDAPKRWQMPLVCASCGGKQFEVTQLYNTEQGSMENLELLCTGCRKQTYTVKQNTELKMYYTFNQEEKNG